MNVTYATKIKNKKSVNPPILMQRKMNEFLFFLCVLIIEEFLVPRAFIFDDITQNLRIPFFSTPFAS